MLRFIKLALITNFKAILSSKLDFWINIAIAVLKQALFLLAWYFFFDKYKTVGNWTYKELLLMYGIVSFGVGFVEIFLGGTKELPQIIEKNQLDIFLLQPKNLLLNIALSRGKISSLGDMATSVYCFVLSGYLFAKPLLILATLPLAVIFIFSMNLYISSLAFFMQNCSNFIKELHSNALIVSSQPLSSYHGFFKILTFTLLPVMFIGFFPVEFIKNLDFKSFFIALIGVVVFFIISCKMFYIGIHKCQS
jgi:ABC-2 type transport system permease protein